MASICSASTVILQWDPNAEPDLAGYKVYYAIDSAPLSSATPIDVLNQTSTTINGLDPSKSYDFAVTAYNTSGMESSFSNVVIVAEMTPPAVDITSPMDATSVSGIVPINVNASDNVGVVKVEFYVNGVLKVAETASPYTYSWDTSLLQPGSYTLMAKAYDAAGNASQSSRTVNVVNDTIPPMVVLIAPAANSTLSGTVSINASASDNVGVSMVEVYANGALLYASNTSPYSYVWDTKSVANGNYTLYARASDNNGNVTNSQSVTVTVNNIVPDVTAPIVSGFSLPATSSSLTVTVSSLTATDDRGVTGYLITESSVVPSSTAAGWSSTAPASFTFSGEGSRTAYAWAKDAAGNISAFKSSNVVITLPDVTAPVVVEFTIPAMSKSLTVPISVFTASDNLAVTAYMVTESSTKPSITSSAWRTTPPTSYRLRSAGSKVLYAWVKDAAGNISAAKTAKVTIDITAPTLNGFSVLTTSTSLTVPVLTFSASDNIGVTGYMITESSTKPLANAARWSAVKPSSYTFSAAGYRTAYAWVKDSAGNVSAYKAAKVNITLSAL